MLNRETLSSEAGDDVFLDKIVRDLKSQDLTTQIRAVCIARSLIYKKNHSTSSMVEAGIISPLVEALDRFDCPNLQYETMGVLSNVAFGAPEHTATVIESIAIPKLIKFLTYEYDLGEWQIKLSERALLILGNIALLGPAARRDVLARGAVRAMLPHMRTDAPVRRLRTFVRAFSNLCSLNDDDDKTHLELVSPALPYIHDILDIENEESLDPDDKETPFIVCDIIVDACTALTNIMLGPDECIEAVQTVPGLTTRLVGLLGHETTCVTEVALRAVGNMLAGTDDQVDRCLDVNCLDYIVSLLQCNNPSLVKEAARATSNMFAGPHAQIQRALDKDILTPLQTILADGESECQKQAMYAVTCLCYNGSAVQRARLVLSGALQPYCALLAAEDRAVAGEVLDGLDALLQAAERDGNVKPLCYMLDELDVLDHTQLLQERVTDEDLLCKLVNMRATLRQHAREERTIVHDGVSFTLQKIVEDLETEELATKKRAIRAAYSILTEKYPPINALMEASIIPPLVRGLNYPDLQSTSTWALAYISKTRKHRIAVLDTGTLPTLLALLVRQNQAAKLAAGTLGNIAMYGPETREAVLAHVQHSETALEDLRTYTRNFNRLASQLRQDSMKKYKRITIRALPFVSDLLVIGDQPILEEVCRGCANLMLGPDDHSIEEVQAVPGLTARLVALLGHEAARVREEALRAVANMLSGTVAQADRWLEAGCLDHVTAIMQSNKPALIELATLSIRNLFSHKPSHIQQALEKDVLTPLRNVLAEGDDACKKQAAYAITNLCIQGSEEQRGRVVLSGALQPYCALLASEDREIARNVLGGIYVFIKDAVENDKSMIPQCLNLVQIGVINHLQRFEDQESDNEIRSKAVAMRGYMRLKALKEQVAYEDGKVLTLEEIIKDLKSQDLETLTRGVRAVRSMLVEKNSPRTAMVQAGVVPLLAAALDRHDCSKLQRIATEAIFIMTAGTQRHRGAVINSGAIPKLIALLAEGGESAEPAALALGFLSRKAPTGRDLVLSHGVVKAMLPHLHWNTPPGLLRACVTTYLNCCTAIVSNSMLKFVIPALPSIVELLDVEDKLVLGPACSAIANLMQDLEDTEMVQTLPRLSERLVALLKHEDYEMKTIAIGAMANMLTGTSTQVTRYIDAGCLDHIVSFLKCNDPSLVAEAARAAANIFRHETYCVQRALEKDFLTPLQNILADAEPNSFVQYHAACAMANLTCGAREHKIAVVQGGAIPNLVALLSHEAAVAEPAVLALGNIVGREKEITDAVLTHGAVQAMLPYMQPNIPSELLRKCVDAYKNICADIVSPSMLEHVAPGLPYLSAILKEVEDQDVLRSACVALGNLMLGPDENKEAVQAVPGLTARLVALLGHEEAIVREAAMGAVLNMLRGTETQVERCLDAGCVDYIEAFLHHKNSHLTEMAVQAIGNMCRYIPAIERALQKDIITPLLNILAKEKPNSSLQFLAAGVFNNLSASGSDEQIMAIVDIGAIPKLVPLLSHEAAVAEVAALSLGFIAGADPGAKDLVRAHGAVPAMMLLMSPDRPLKLWSSCLLAYGKIRSEEDDGAKLLELLSPMLPRILALQDTGDEQDTILIERSFGALIVLMETNEGIEAVQATPGLTERLVGLLRHEAARVKRVVIIAVMFMLSGTDTQIDSCLAANCVENILSYLESRDSFIMEEAAKATRSMLGAEHPWIQRALGDDSLTPLMAILGCTPRDLKRIVKAISNLCRRALAGQRARLVSGGALQPCGALLAARGPYAGHALDALEALLQVSRNENNLEPFCVKLVEMGVHDEMKILQDHEDAEINEKARRLLRTYFPEKRRRRPTTAFSYYFLLICFQLSCEVWNQILM